MVRAFGWNRRSFSFESGYGLLQMHGVVEDGGDDDQAAPARLVLKIRPADRCFLCPLC